MVNNSEKTRCKHCGYTKGVHKNRDDYLKATKGRHKKWHSKVCGNFSPRFIVIRKYYDL